MAFYETAWVPAVVEAHGAAVAREEAVAAA